MYGQINTGRSMAKTHAELISLSRLVLFILSTYTCPHVRNTIFKTQSPLDNQTTKINIKCRFF